MAAQGVFGREVAGLAGEWFVDRDDAQLGVEILERGDELDGELGAGFVEDQLDQG